MMRTRGADVMNLLGVREEVDEGRTGVKVEVARREMFLIHLEKPSAICLLNS